MLNDFPYKPVAWSDVPFSNFMQIFIILISNFEFGPNVCSKSLVKLMNVKMDNVFAEKLPGKSEMISSFGRWSEVKFSIIFF